MSITLEVLQAELEGLKQQKIEAEQKQIMVHGGIQVIEYLISKIKKEEKED